MTGRGVACPACGGPAQTPAPGRIAACRACSHRWLAYTAAEQARLEQSLYGENYEGYSDDPALVRSFEALLRGSLGELIPAGGHVLDVGCGAGTFLEVAGKAGYRAEGLDVSPAAAEICRARGCNAKAGDFLTYGEPASFDAVTLWDVVEHLREPAAFLAHAREIVRPGGVIVGKVPVFGALSVSLADRVPRLRGVLLGAPAHVQYFSRATLARLLDRSGLQWKWLGLPTKGMRTPASGGSLRKRLARAGRKAVVSLSGDGNALFAARV